MRARVTFELKNATLFDEKGQNRSEKSRGFDSLLLNLPFCEQLAVGLIYDKGESYMHVRDVELWDWKMSFKQAMELAMENLRAISTRDFRVIEEGINLWVAAWPDEHTAARLLLPELFERLKVRGELVVMTPTADRMLVADSADRNALLGLFEISSSLRRQPRPIPMQPMVLRKEVWEPFVLKPNHPCYQEWHLFCLAAMNVTYEQDAERIFKSTKDAVFAPIPEVVQDSQTGELYTKAIVPEGRRTSLPRCDYLEFFRQTEDGQFESLGVCRLERAMSILGSRIEEEGGYPPRVMLKSFPDRTQIPLLGFEKESTLPAYVPPEPVVEEVVEEEDEEEEEEEEAVAGNSAVYVPENTAEEVAVGALDDGDARVDASAADSKEDAAREDELDAEENSASVDEAFTDESIQSVEAKQQLEQ